MIGMQTATNLIGSSMVHAFRNPCRDAFNNHNGYFTIKVSNVISSFELFSNLLGADNNH